MITVHCVYNVCVCVVHNCVKTGIWVIYRLLEFWLQIFPAMIRTCY